MYLFGYDIGSSSIKATLLNGETGEVVATATSPSVEMEIMAQRPGWAEQEPETWWRHVQKATARIREKAPQALADTRAIGISYQMHGLVIVDKNGTPLRPSIIWCDSRAVSIGNEANMAMGPKTCLKRLLNSPGNFTASKLKWVKEHEPAIFSQIHKAMLPGDYIAMKLTGLIRTTPSGLSEGILWDYETHGPAQMVLDHYGIPGEMLAELCDTFSIQGELSKTAAEILGMKAGIPISYRAGDQPNNALSLNVLEPGEIAATAGTSGVVYGVGDQPSYDEQSRVNSFLHVNHHDNAARLGVLLCVSGTGILNSWLKHQVVSDSLDYPAMNELADKIPAGSDGLVVLPFGNGAERTLGNQDIGAHISGLNFNIHTRAHLLRAAQEGIVFALNYGLDIMKDMGLTINTIRAGHANMFLSPIFASTFATLTGARIELYNTDGSQGAARGAGFGAGLYGTLSEAFHGLTSVKTIDPVSAQQTHCLAAYDKWLIALKNLLNNPYSS